MCLKDRILLISQKVYDVVSNVNAFRIFISVLGIVFLFLDIINVYTITKSDIFAFILFCYLSITDFIVEQQTKVSGKSSLKTKSLTTQTRKTKQTKQPKEKVEDNKPLDY